MRTLICLVLAIDDIVRPKVPEPLAHVPLVDPCASVSVSSKDTTSAHSIGAGLPPLVLDRMVVSSNYEADEKEG